jgi:HAD superfamily hydrolase (TIGR01509 family)
MAIKAIIFDCFGVFVLSGRESVVKDFPDIKQDLHDLTVRSDYGFISRDDFNKELSDFTHIPADEVEARYWAKSTRNESVFQWANELKKAGGYKIGLLSNIGINWLNDFFPEEERKSLFDDVVLSSDVGYIKPDRKIFEIAAERLGVDTTECVMIDDLLENIEAASSVGMQGIVYGSTGEARAELERLLEPGRA